METLEHLRHRLETLDELGSLVRTMKALAAASIHQHEHAVRALSMYYRTVELGLHVVLRDLDPWPPRPQVPRSARQAAVVLGSDHGMCGRFNEAVAEHATRRLERSRREGAAVRILAVGSRVVTHLEQAGFPPDSVHPVPTSTARITQAVRRILVQIDGWQAQGVERVRLFYNRHVSSAEYEPGTERLLPLDLARFRGIERQEWESRSLPIFSMERRELLAALVRQFFFVTVFRACAESLASENGARLAAMQSAEKNLEDHRSELGTAFRRARQDHITSELLDVVSGYEATRAGG